MIEQRGEEGFSAVELLITLFIATIFFISGYQLWGEVQASGVASDHLSRASNVSYEYLRRYTSSSQVCSVSKPVNNVAITVDGLANPKVTVAITCPFGTGPGSPTIRLITSTVTYGSTTNPESVSHAIYAG